MWQAAFERGTVTLEGTPETGTPAGAATLRRPALTLDGSGRGVSAGGRHVSLSVRERALLVALMDAGGRTLTAEALLRIAWNESPDPASCKVRVVIARLRRKLGGPELIETIGREGYRLVPVDELPQR